MYVGLGGRQQKLIKLVALERRMLGVIMVWVQMRTIHACLPFSVAATVSALDAACACVRAWSELVVYVVREFAAERWLHCLLVIRESPSLWCSRGIQASIVCVFIGTGISDL